MFKLSRFSDRYIDLSLLVISIFGIIMIGSASVDASGDWFPAIKNMGKQMFFVGTGYFLMLVARKIFSTKKIGLHLINTGYYLILVLMLACLAFPAINGAKAWLHLGITTLQPSEFAKILCIVLLAFYFNEVPQALRVSNNLSSAQKVLMKQKLFKKGFCEPLGRCLILFFICFLLQNDLGTAIIMFVICMVCFFSANHSYYKFFQKQLWTVMLAGIAAIGVGLPIVMNFLHDYQKARITSWLDPLNPEFVLNQSYQLVNGMIAFTNGGLVGLGLGNSTQKFGYIPEAYNDFITAIICEELGMFGLALIIIPFTTIIVRLFKYAFKMEDGYSKVILIGIATYFFMHLFLNLGGVSGLIPMTGVPLLCISAGGSSTWACFMAIGIAQGLIQKYNKAHS